MVTNFTLLLSLSLLVQLAYWLLVFKRLADYSYIRTSETVQNPIEIGIIICVNMLEARTEENFKQILSQNYPNYTVYIVDNGRDQDLKALLQRLESNYHNLKVLNYMDNALKGKKHALKYALKSIPKMPFLLTDADCFPESENWLNIMATEMMSSNKDVILGYSPYLISNKSLLNRWIHYEGFLTGVQYLSFAIAKMPYMGVGRNLLYNIDILTREILERHSDLVSGDDDLSVNELSKEKAVGISISPQSFVYSYPKTGWYDYFNQKQRHYSTSHKYKPSDLLHLILLSSSHFLFYVSIIVLLFQKAFIVVITIYLIRWLVILPILNKIRNKLHAKISIAEYLVFDFFHVIYYMIFAYSVIFPQKHKW